MAVPALTPYRVLGPDVYDLGVPQGGLNLSAPPSEIAPTFAVAAQGVRMRKGTLRGLYGRSKVGSQLSGGVQRVTHILRYQGNPQALVLTENKLYKWSGGDWLEVREVYDTGTVDVTNGDATITGNGTSWTDFVNAGDAITIDSVDYVVDSVTSDTELELTVVYAGLTDTAVAYSVSLLLQGDLQYATAEGFGENQWFFTNQVDWVKTYDGTDLTTLTGAAGYQTDDYHKCRSLLYYGQSLVLLSTIEDGTDVFQRVRWSDVGDVTTWSSDNFYDCVETPGRIIRGELLGGAVVIYKRDSVLGMTAIGGQWGFQFTPERTGIGCVAANSLINLGNAHFFLGEVFGSGYEVLLNIGSDIVPITGPIRNKLQSLVTRDTVWRSFSVWNPADQQIWLFTPMEDSSYPNKVWIYEMEGGNPTRGRWWEDEVTMTGGGTALAVEGLQTIGDLVGTIGDQDWVFGDANLGDEVEIGHMGDESGNVIKIDMSSGLDEEGNQMLESYTTKALTSADIGGPPGTTIQTTGIEVVARGTSIDVEYSLDEGISFIDAGTITLDNDETTRKALDFKANGDSIMFRLSYTGTIRFLLEHLLVKLRARGHR